MPLPAAVASAAIATNWRRSNCAVRLIKSASGMMPSFESKGLALPATFAGVIGHIPVSGRNHRAAEAGWSRAPESSVLMRLSVWSRN
jgi:hypothetical protein